MKLIWLIPFFLVAVYAKLDRYFYKKNDYFCPNCIHLRWDRSPQLATPDSEDIYQILTQPFSYLSQGKQSFVFVSGDGEWVIKFVRLPRYLKLASLKGKKSSLPFFESTLKSFKASYEELSKETGILYAHTAPSTHLNHELKLTDKLGAPHSLSLDTLPFAIQKRGEDFFTVLGSAPVSEAKTLIRKAVNLYGDLYQKGYIDNDPIMDKNFGIREGEPFILDVGQLEKMQTPLPKEEYLKKMTISMHTYLETKNQELFAFYKNLLH